MGFKNSGLTAWRNYGDSPVALTPVDATTQSFSDNSWLTDSQIVLMKTKEVEPGQIGYFEFYLAPSAQPLAVLWRISN